MHVNISPTWAPILQEEFSKEYFKSLPKANALLPGIVQGVVVQITILEPSRCLSKELLIKNFTYIVLDV